MSVRSSLRKRNLGVALVGLLGAGAVALGIGHWRAEQEWSAGLRALQDDVYAPARQAVLDAAQQRGHWLLTAGQADTLLSETLLALGDEHGHLATMQRQHQGDGRQITSSGLMLREQYVVGFYQGSQPPGIQRGDQLLAVDGVPFAQKAQIQDKLRQSGPHGYLLGRAGQQRQVRVQRSVVAEVMQPYAARQGKVAYIQMPFNGFPEVTTQAQTRYVRESAAALAGVAAPALCGVVLDLRLDLGGDPLSQLKVASLVLGGGVYEQHASRRFTSDLLKGVDSTGAAFEGTILDNAYSYTRQLTVAIPAASALALQRPHVAVLIGDGTASSGEIVALGARSRAHTRLFGTPTYGDTTSLLVAPLPDGSLLTYSSAYFTDSQGHAQTGPILPNQTVKTDWATFGTAVDPVIQAAQRWLDTQGCHPTS